MFLYIVWLLFDNTRMKRAMHAYRPSVLVLIGQ